MRKQSFALLASLLLAAVLAAPAQAGGHKKKKEVEHHEMLISSVAGNAVTIGNDEGSKTLNVGQFTEIAVKGQKASLADLKPGMMVNVTYGVDGVTPSRINAEDAPLHHDSNKKDVRAPKGWMK